MKSVVLVPLLLCALGTVFIGCERQQTSVNDRPDTRENRLFSPGSGCVELGRLEVKQTRSAILKVTNPINRSISINRFDVSCPCLRVVDRLPLSVPARASHTITLEFNPNDEPDFRGALSIALKGFDATNVEVFETTVNLEVVGAATGRGLTVPQRIGPPDPADPT